MPTAAMLMLAICPGDSPNSPLMTGINGATANQAKKHTKKANQLMWKARMAGVEKENSWIRVSFTAVGFIRQPAFLTPSWSLGKTPRRLFRKGTGGHALRRCVRELAVQDASRLLRVDCGARRKCGSCATPPPQRSTLATQTQASATAAAPAGVGICFWSRFRQRPGPDIQARGSNCCGLVLAWPDGEALTPRGEPLAAYAWVQPSARIAPPGRKRQLIAVRP
jgi:hypothetical protein